MSHAWVRGHEEAVKGKEMCRRDCGSEGSEGLKGVWWGNATDWLQEAEIMLSSHQNRQNRQNKAE